MSLLISENLILNSNFNKNGKTNNIEIKKTEINVVNLEKLTYCKPSPVIVNWIIVKIIIPVPKHRPNHHSRRIDFFKLLNISKSAITMA